LNASGDCGIGDDDIKELVDLEELNASNNPNITKLEILDTSGKCGIDNNGVTKLINLKVLDVTENIEINDIKHMQKLRILHT